MLSWPEQVVRVQSLSESGIRAIPSQYIKPLTERPVFEPGSLVHQHVDIPVIDLHNLFCKDPTLHLDTLSRISAACREWGFFQAVNHGVSHELMRRAREVWRDFFNLPLEVKQEYANTPITYEGYGSRLGVEKGAILDWSDYFFLHYLPVSLRNQSKWPEQPSSCREVIVEYGGEVVKLCTRLLKAMSTDLGLEEEYIKNAFGGDNMGACLRVNFYPKCPQPELTLGLSSHSDPGGITILLPDRDVSRLQVFINDDWITVNPVSNSLIVIVGDQIQVVSNAIYKSVEHRVMVNSAKDGVSLAMFFNPKSDLVIEPAKEVVSEERPALYDAMTFDHYRLHMRMKGPCGKARLESLKFNTP
ncbi:Jasmonic Acid Oxidase 3, JASMONATE-INDUCED OXYGENASE3, jasmonate-regulated gene 21 [Hibiscus trionum]|uniref:Jasmonic Acid Oxidase 3, JASMONATE-INDUCED OXYGENASE3, jasmonate-regulated gene 21 n=1 Tax=Hibiscus trionum TaxID=183268 RepID=A0A9W7HZA6_HIBTR|nr:Jasmonic Acid Oxidase 3, JASMONATE-INDUCED OXYGENASE3, jasmonate-regulated gene 21 [Hibiscus trionum]